MLVKPSNAVLTAEMLSQGNWGSVVYVDYPESACRQSSWNYVLCEEYEDRSGQAAILYRCLLCHSKEIDDNYCHAITEAGRRCAKSHYSSVDGPKYCSYHRSRV